MINKSTIKLSYSCMPNLQSIISSHNRKLLTQPEHILNMGCLQSQTQQQLKQDVNSAIVEKGFLAVPGKDNVCLYIIPCL